ncbi:MAG: amidohydrolase family protein [Chitinophagaceae bacterium]|nr:amidohydrolase family protein [Chitinophagaceae bacterium]
MLYRSRSTPQAKAWHEDSDQRRKRARNFDALIPLLNDYEDAIMFCSDDKHPDSLAEGHINNLCRRAVDYGIDVFKVLKAACLNPIIHYKMDVGRMRPGDKADLVVCGDLRNFHVLATYINGVKVAENGRSLINPQAGRSRK